MADDFLPFRGQVRWFNGTFGYGFIRHHDGREVFVHHSIITAAEKSRQTLREKEWVFYATENTSQGLKAIEVRRTPAALKGVY